VALSVNKYSRSDRHRGHGRRRLQNRFRKGQDCRGLPGRSRYRHRRRSVSQPQWRRDQEPGADGFSGRSDPRREQGQQRLARAGTARCTYRD